MGACRTCGRPAGLGKGECADCASIRLSAAEATAEEQRAAQAAARDSERSAEIQTRVEAIESTVASGRPAYLFDSLYLPVDSIINDEAVGRFDVEPARQYLALGWEICGVVPRTTGVGLKNSTGVVTNAWGGGLGGNVVGVHLLLRYRIDSETLETSRHTMTDHFERTIPLSN